MKIKAWVQMGVERRETVIEIPEEQVQAGREYCAAHGESMECWYEELVLKWAETQRGWGWSGDGWHVDFTHLEGKGGEGTVVVEESAIPSTRVIRFGRDVTPTAG